MEVNEQIFASWSELVLQDLRIDVAAIVDATQSDRDWNNGNVRNALSLGNLRPCESAVDGGNNLGKQAVLKDEGN